MQISATESRTRRPLDKASRPDQWSLTWTRPLHGRLGLYLQRLYLLPEHLSRRTGHHGASSKQAIVWHLLGARTAVATQRGALTLSPLPLVMQCTCHKYLTTHDKCIPFFFPYYKTRVTPDRANTGDGSERASLALLGLRRIGLHSSQHL